MVQPDLAHNILCTGTMRVLYFGQRKPFYVILPDTCHGSPLLLNLFAGYRKEAVSLERR
jgi:hypothetical protein